MHLVLFFRAFSVASMTWFWDFECCYYWQSFISLRGDCTVNIHYVVHWMCMLVYDADVK